MNIFNASPADAGCFYKDIPLFCHLFCQVVNRLKGNIFCDRVYSHPYLSSAAYVRITSSIHEPSPRPQPANKTKYFICFHLHNSRFANDFLLISIAYKATCINAFFMVNQRPFYEHRSVLPVHSPPCAVLDKVECDLCQYLSGEEKYSQLFECFGRDRDIRPLLSQCRRSADPGKEIFSSA